MHSHRFFLLAAAVLIAACERRSAAVIAVTPLDTTPAGADASTPFLAATSSGAMWMSWMERGADSVWTLRAARREATGAWSAPGIVVRDSLLFANWADFPSLVVDARGRLVAHFLRRNGPGKYAYHAWLTVSSDSGRSWSTPQRLHSDSGNGEHGFAALVPQDDGSTLAAWLDGRGGGGTTGAMSLGAGGLDPVARVRPDTLLDIRTCDCCQVAGTALPDGAIFAYRDRSADEVRDIAVVAYRNGAWTAPALVHDDQWVTSACPVNGPSLASQQMHVALAWFTKARDTAMVKLARSDDGGLSWSVPVRIDDGAPLGRVAVALLRDGSTLTLWMERTGTATAEIRARRVARDGASTAAVRVASTSDARAAGFPRLAVMPDGAVMVAWREMTSPARVRLARLSVATP